jgi:putative transposase
VIPRETDQSQSSKREINAMTAADDIDWPQVLAERLTTTPRRAARAARYAHPVMGAEADAVCGAN